MIQKKDSETQLSQRIGVKIRERMADQGVGQHELSRRTGVPVMTINGLVSANKRTGGNCWSPRVGLLLRVAEALDCELTDLL